MAKIDVTKIDGYDAMSAEDKLKALEEFEVDEPDYTGFVKKDVFDKTASELATTKKQLKEKMSDDESQKLKEQEEKEELQKNYEKLLRESEVSKNKAKLLALGYEEKLADDTAAAIVDGNTEKVFANQKKHQDSLEKQIRGKALLDTPRPEGDGDGDNVMTLDKLRKMTSQERYEYSTKNPEEYKNIYGGKE